MTRPKTDRATTAGTSAEHRTPDEDHGLATRVRAGDYDAWVELVERHAPRLGAYLGARIQRPRVVDQLVADAVYNGWLGRDGIEVDNFAAWFRRLGANLALRWRERHKDEPLIEPFPLDRCAGNREMAERLDCLERALYRLNKSERRVLEQRYRGGMDGKVLAQALRVPTGKVNRTIDKALDRLVELMAADP